jgi:hypothetical protein
VINRDKEKVENIACMAMVTAIESGGNPSAIIAAAIGVATGVIPDEAVAAANYGQFGGVIGGFLGGPPGAAVGTGIGAVLGAAKNSPYCPDTFPTVSGALIGGAVCGPPCAVVGATFFGTLSGHQNAEFHKKYQAQNPKK